MHLHYPTCDGTHTLPANLTSKHKASIMCETLMFLVRCTQLAIAGSQLWFVGCCRFMHHVYAESIADQILLYMLQARSLTCTGVIEAETGFKYLD